MKQKSLAVVLAGALLLLPAKNLKSETISLSFGSPVPGTIQDRNSLGTGFTERLPGTGMSIGPNDSNLYINQGKLEVTTVPFTEQYPVTNSEYMEAPGFFLQSSANKNLSITALFKDVHVDAWSDHFSIYAGTSITKNIMASFHLQLSCQNGPAELRDYLFYATNETVVDGFEYPDYTKTPGVSGIFSNGDDLLLSLERKNDFWQMKWDNLTNTDPSKDGSSAYFSSPWLDNQDLYVGIYAGSPRSQVGVTSNLESFVVNVNYVPEPSTLSLLTTGGLTGIGVYVLSRRKEKQN